MSRPVTLILAGAATAAWVLLAIAITSVIKDEEIRDCRAAITAADDAHTAREYAAAALQRERYERVVTSRQAQQRAETDLDEATRVLDAARDQVARLCLDEHTTTTATT